MSANDERISNKSVDLGEFNKERLLEMFPIFRTEGGGVDFDRLKLALGESVDVGKEVFGMRWPGKADSIRLANSPSHGTLSPDGKESVNFDVTENLIIEGDNLEVLKLLQKAYQGKVKMIYIDPPYNTGSDLVYEDDFTDGIKNYLHQTGQIDGEGNRLSTNSETNGRVHSNWMSMMLPRLIAAQSLLRDDGLMFISINDIEQANLKILCNEIFGEENFVAVLVWMKGKEGGNDNSGFGQHHEYVICYAKNFLNGTRNIDLDEKDESRHITSLPEANLVTPGEEIYKDGEPFQLINLSKQKDYVVDIPLVDGSILTWDSYSPQKSIDELVRIGKLFVGKRKVPYVKSFMSDEKQGTKPSSVIESSYGTTKAGGISIRDLFGNGKIFSYPKPPSLIERLIKISGYTGERDLVLDFFAGSGTTAHAVMALNAKDGGKRKFILVQLPEKVDPESEAAKAGFENIADITKERVRRAGKKIIEESDGKLKLEGEEALDFGFRVLKLNESNIEDWNSEEASKSPKDLMDALKTTRLKSGRSEQDVVFEVLVKYGIELTSSVEELKVGKGSVWKIAGGDLIVVVAPGLANDDLNAIVKMSPKVVVMLDEAFVPEALKTNARATFKDAKIELKTF